MTAVNQFALLIAVPFLLRYECNRFSVILRPGLTQLYHSGAEPEKSKKMAILLLRFTGFMAATAFVGIWMINGAFVTHWVGEEYYAGDLANFLTAMLTALTIWTFGFKVLLEVRFEFKRRGLTFFACGLLSVVLALILVRKFGLPGVLLGAIIAETATIFPFVLSNVCSWLFNGQSWIRGFFKISWLPSLLIAVWVVLQSEVGVTPSSWLEIVSFSLIVAAACILAGGFWLWSDLRQYGVFRKMNEHFFKTIDAKFSKISRPAKT